jgi:hypothetical protein
MAEVLDRARHLIDAGAHNAQVAEIAAVHDAIWPAQAPICPTLTCRAVLGRAFFTIKRWLDQQDNSPSTSTDSTVSKSTSTARFHSDSTTLFPHGLGVAFSNDNLTDSAARYILKHDPDAKQFFKVLPPAAEGEEEFNPEAQQAQATTEPASAPATSSAASPEAGIDYAKLAAYILDEQERRAVKPAAPALTASAGGADSKDNDHGDEKPLPLSRQNKEQLMVTYRAELKTEPGEDLLNDDLRDAITQHRAGQQDPE